MKSISLSRLAVVVVVFAMIITTVNAQNQNNFSTKKENTMIAMLVTFNTKPEQKEILKTALMEDVESTKKEKGNITMQLYEHKDKPNTLYLFERWENQKALDEHFEKPYTKKVVELNKTALASPMEILYLSDFNPLERANLKKPLSADNPVDLVVIFKVKEGMQERFVQQFQKSVQNSRPEVGNIAFHIHAVKDDPTAFVLFERWRNQEALDFHFSQSYTKELFEIFKDVLDKPVEESLNFIVEIGYLKRNDK